MIRLRSLQRWQIVKWSSIVIAIIFALILLFHGITVIS